MISKETHLLIGQCGLLVREVENEFELEIAYSILPQFRGKGFAIEAAQKCKYFAFENKFHNRLVSIIIPENKDSKNVALKNGMNFNRQINYSEIKSIYFRLKKRLGKFEVICILKKVNSVILKHEYDQNKIRKRKKTPSQKIGKRRLLG